MSFDFGKLKGIIFDLGGVIINLKESETVNRFGQLGKKTHDEVKQLVGSTPFKNFEKGLINEAEFRNEVRMHLCQEASDQDIDDGWNAMLGDIPHERLKLLEGLKEKYQLYLLSNTNAIHLRRFNEIVKSTTGKDSLQHYFKKVYYSHTVGMRKPEKEIYEWVLNDNNLMAGETLFLDDNASNLEGAASVGIHTFHVTHPNLILDLFK